RRALPGPVAGWFLADHVLVAVAQLPAADLAEQRDRLPRRGANLRALAVRERDHDAGGVRIAHATIRPQHVGQHLMILGLDDLARDGLAERVELPGCPAPDLLSWVPPGFDQGGDGAISELFELQLGVHPQKLAEADVDLDQLPHGLDRAHVPQHPADAEHGHELLPAFVARARGGRYHREVFGRLDVAALSP